MIQLPSSGRHSMLYRGKLQGGHANWYCGIRWAFRTRWRLVSLGKASSGRNWFKVTLECTSVEGASWVSLVFEDIYLVLV